MAIVEAAQVDVDFAEHHMAEHIIGIICQQLLHQLGRFG